MLRIAFIIIVATFLFHNFAQASTEQRVALVIGNSSYKFASELANPKNDARTIAKALKNADFDVTLGLDLEKRELERIIRKFTKQLRSSEIGVFFYAGHGLQVHGKNYLVPIDAKLEDIAGIDFELVRLDTVQRTMERWTKTNIIFLDACRNNPLARNLARSMGTRAAGIGRGLAPVESGIGTLISFSTQPGNVAYDGDDDNSPYSAALARHLGREGYDITDILINVRKDVMQSTKRRQVPWEHSALTNRLYIVPTKPKPQAPSSSKIAETAYWNAVKDSPFPQTVRRYLSRYPSGKYAPTARQLIDKLKTEQARKAEASAREAELKRVEQEKRDAEAKRQQALRRERQAKQATEFKAALDELRRSQEELKRIESKRQEAIKAAEKARQAEKQAKLEAERLAKTQQKSNEITVANLPVDQQAQPDLTSLSQKELALRQQIQLKRLGCYTSVIDGDWGAGSRRAMANLNRYAKLKLPTDSPDAETTEILIKINTQICPFQKRQGTKQSSKTKTNNSSTKKRSTSKKRTRNVEKYNRCMETQMLPTICEQYLR